MARVECADSVAPAIRDRTRKRNRDIEEEEKQEMAGRIRGANENVDAHRVRSWPECLKKRAPRCLFAEMVDGERGTSAGRSGQDCVSELERWFEENGIWFDRSTCAIEVRGGRRQGENVRSIGLISTKRRIPVGSVIARMEKSSMLTTRSGHVPIWLRDRLDEYDLHGSANGLALTLMRERLVLMSGGTATSHWSAYIFTMPVAAPIAPLFTDAQMEELRGTDAYGTCVRLRARIIQEWNRCGSVIAMEAFSRIRPPRLLPRTPTGSPPLPLGIILFREYVYCVSLVMSRAFSVDHFFGMGCVPFADLLDHDQDEHVHFTGEMSDRDICISCGRVAEGVMADEADEGVPLCHRCLQDGAHLSPPPANPGWDERNAIVFEVVREVAGRSSQVFNTYGDCCNRKLLCFYGFTSDPGRNDENNVVNLSLDHVLRAYRDVLRGPERDERSTRRLLRIAAQAGVLDTGDEAYSIRMHRRAPMGARLLRLLLILATGYDHVEEVEEVGSTDTDSEMSLGGCHDEEGGCGDAYEVDDRGAELSLEKNLLSILPRPALKVAIRAIAMRMEDLANKDDNAGDVGGDAELGRYLRDLEALRALRKKKNDDAESEVSYFIMCCRIDEWRCLRNAKGILTNLCRRAHK